MKAKINPRKKVTIQFDEEHLQTIATAMEVYSRLRSGQIKFAFDAAFCDKDLTYSDSEAIESFVRTFVFRNDKTIADNRNAYYGVGQEEMKDGTVAWEIKKTIEQYLHYQRNDGCRNIMDVSGDGPMQISKVPVPKILNFEPSKTFPVPKKAYDILNKAFEKNDWETMWATVELAFKNKPLPKGKSTKIEKVDNQWVVIVNEPYINK
jgi:hypothetical protein